MEIIHVQKRMLVLNQVAVGLYGAFNISNYDDYHLLMSIQDKGILEPILITNDYQLISGNRRLSCALMIESITNVPCIVVVGKTRKDIDENLTISHNQQRHKDEVAIAWEYEFLMRKYNLTQGPGGKTEHRRERDAIIGKSVYSKKTIMRVLEAKKYIMIFKGCSEEDAWNHLKKELRDEGLEVNKILSSAKENYIRKTNKEKLNQLPKEDEDQNFVIYRKSNNNLKDIIGDNEVNCVVTSPPYYNKMRTYVRDDGENLTPMGDESTPERYIENLMTSMGEMVRTLKDDGSIWLNIYDPIIDGIESDISDEIIRRMKGLGIQKIARLVWIKSNPTYSDGNRLINNKEWIIHFAKSTQYKWIKDWYSSADYFLHNIAYGSTGKKRTLKCVFTDPAEGRVSAIETNSHNTANISKLMKSKGLTLTHNAMFPAEVALVCIRSTTNEQDLVLDPFSGLGTTGIVAWACGCKYKGVEISNEYKKMSEIRFKDFKQNYLNNQHSENDV